MEAPEKNTLKTLSSCIESLQKTGFDENFMVKEKGLRALDKEKYYAPGEVRVINFYRFEGESDPADSAILYAIETNDGVRGLLSDAYGAYADENTTKFMTEVEDIMKKTDKEVKL
jgi:hypothetical protein